MPDTACLTDSLPAARVYRAFRGGWFYQIDQGFSAGPYPHSIAAGRAARAALLAMADAAAPNPPGNPPGNPLVARRDLADMCATAAEIAIDLKYASAALGDAFEGDRDEAQAKAGALALLFSAREGIAELIAKLEAA